jgi:hypothetical protein
MSPTRTTGPESQTTVWHYTCHGPITMLLLPYYYACAVDSYYHLSDEAKALAIRHKPSSSEPRQEKESRLLVDIYRSRPSWSYGDIAEQLYQELRLWDPETRRTRSSRACARRLLVLYRLGHLDHSSMSYGFPLSLPTANETTRCTLRYNRL